MAQLLQTSITGSLTSTGSLIISGSEPVQLPLLSSGSGEIDLTTPYQLWFDPGDNYVKYHLKGSHEIGTWNAGGSLSCARYLLAGAGSNQADSMIFGGLIAPSTYLSLTEEYNGTSFAAGGSLITARSHMDGAGTQNAGMTAGGYNGSVRACTEEYNGSSWAVGGNLITARYNNGVTGTQNAGLAVGGQTPTVVSCNEEYNGSSWSAEIGRAHV